MSYNSLSESFMGTITPGIYVRGYEDSLGISDLAEGLRCVLRRRDFGVVSGGTNPLYVHREYSVEIGITDETEFETDGLWSLPGLSHLHNLATVNEDVVNLVPVTKTGQANTRPGTSVVRHIAESGAISRVVHIPFLGMVKRNPIDGYLIRPYKAVNEFPYQDLEKQEQAPPL